MTLSGAQLKERLGAAGGKRLVMWPLFDVERQIDAGAASLDLRLGPRFAAARRRRMTHLDPYKGPDHPTGFMDEHYVAVGRDFVLHPRHFVLATTLEWVRVPDDLAGYITCRSTLGRLGLNIATAAGIHPRFAGIITLELANLADVPIVIRVGQPICQVFFHEVKATTVMDGTVFLGSKRPRLGWLSGDRIDRFLGIGQAGEAATAVTTPASEVAPGRAPSASTTAVKT